MGVWLDYRKKVIPFPKSWWVATVVGDMSGSYCDTVGSVPEGCIERETVRVDHNHNGSVEVVVITEDRQTAIDEARRIWRFELNSMWEQTPSLRSAATPL
jgi:hypothetical protein